MPSILRTTILTVLSGAVAVSAHGVLGKVTASGQTFQGFDATSAPSSGPHSDSVTWSNDANYDSFVPSSAVNDPDIICHLNATNAQLSVPVAAGESVELTWSKWSENHKGPVIDYLADCGGDCATVDKTALKFFKIAEAGQLSLGDGAGQPGRWADDEIIENGLKWTVEIPASIKPGNYVLRHEIIALHNAVQDGKAELYPQCVNLEISGSGTEAPDGVAGTALYQASDAGLKYDIYNDEQAPTYKIPGPALFAAGNNGPKEVAKAATNIRTATPFRA
ncbi:endoglucanase-4 [Apiospora rasikravindrae]|uniref:lytic cellulose monooxygenase (C4-dehydrogenating) n=1 Tax=Apiospora rasikravindrae TaxID=990691 RepID=A0ABR1T2J7_9PEZI